MTSHEKTIKRKKKKWRLKMAVRRWILLVMLVISGLGFLKSIEFMNDAGQTPTKQGTLQPIEEWNLILVNQEMEMPDHHKIKLIQLKDGSYIDERIYPDLQQMFDEARRVGLSPVVNSAYRAPNEQQQIYEEKINQYLTQGYSKKEAKELASEWVAVPGHSEHETGLSLDIIGEDGSSPSVQEWLRENSYKYGFILRYPNGKEHITGINHEPWHYRYVGKEAAKEIYDQQLTLEEYLEHV